MKFDTHRTNPNTLLRWDADWYKSLPDEDCVVCLTEKQIYLIHEMLEPLLWVNTRWIGDTSDLDFDLIKSDLQFALDERMTCEKLTLLAQQIESISAQIDLIQNSVFQGDNTIDVDTTVLDDIFNTAAQEAQEIFETENCTDDDKDAIYGACNALVRHIHQNNLDFLESISQAGNVTDQAKRLLAGIPLVGLLPLDEVADYATFIIDELLEEYNATVTEELLQMVICDLFCIARDSPCSLDFADLLNYFGDHVSPTLTSAATTFLNLVQFALIGTFSGDGYFYYLCYFQLWIAYAGSEFFGQTGVQTIAMVARSGLNSPDADWEIFCTDCPEPPVYPDLVTTRCQDALSLGTLTQIDENHWHIESELHTDNNHYCMLRDTAIDISKTFKIMAITNMSPALWDGNGTVTTATCVVADRFGWNNMIGQASTYEYMFSSAGTTAFSFDIEVSEIGA